EKGKPIDMLLGRNREPLQGWLKRRPGIEIVVRDRASAYADAIQGGAPEAIQVADRFHLVKNVSDAFKEVVDRQSWAMAVPAPLPVCVSEPEPPPEPAKRMTREQRERAAAADRLQHRYEEVHRLHNSGMSIQGIRNVTGLSRPTIYKYLACSEVPKRAVSRATSKLDPFVAYLAERWHMGCHRMQTLYDEIVQLGYTGSISRLNYLLQPWRAECPPVPAKAPRHPAQKTDRQKPKATWKEVRAILLCPPESLNRDRGRLLVDFLALNPPLALAYLLLQRFRTMLKEHDSDAFAEWLSDAAATGLAPFERLAKSFGDDRSAILAAITLTWSTGPVEGHITRVKLLKRIGYGRASLPLLRARVLNSARRDSRPPKRKRSRKGASQNAIA
ncbi:MAG TPA: ISL3 family transposase, partial [Candidatus Sulfotelmatobacter sp.]|nr:ISL3 family transposase [Candidatus Sulfotelmatobacter sp.]